MHRAHSKAALLTTLTLASMLLMETPAGAQADVGGSREAPPRPEPPPTFLVVAPAPPRALKYASLDLFGDSAESGGSTLYVKFGFVDPSSWLTSRVAGILAFDPVLSQVNDAGIRHTGVGDVWLRVAFTVMNDTSRKLKAGAQYGVKIPTASAEQELGSGRVDHRLGVALDKTWRGVWSSVGLLGFLRGGRDDRVRAVGQLEAPLRSRERWALVYGAYLHLQTTVEERNYSTLQQHGVALQLSSSPLWIGAGASLEQDDDTWTPGGYIRLEVRP
jgi:hypothetical protein